MKKTPDRGKQEFQEFSDNLKYHKTTCLLCTET